MSLAWLKEQYTRLDPAATYAEQMREYDLRRERLFTSLMTTDDPVAQARLSGALDRLSEVRRRWMEAHGYFDAVSFGDIAASQLDESTRRARVVREALLAVFDEVAEEEPDPVAGGTWDGPRGAV